MKYDAGIIGSPIRIMPNAKTEGECGRGHWPVNVWFSGSRTFFLTLGFGGRAIRKITLDPLGRFPDNATADNVWPRCDESPSPRPEVALNF